MAATFDVSPVTPGVNPLPVQPFAAELERRTGSTLEACGGSVPTLVSGQRDHGFLAAVRLAFDQHYPLVLRPDDVWLLIAQGLAHHVKSNAEQLRGAFVDHEGQREIRVERHDFLPGSPGNPWPEVFSAFSAEIGRVIGKKRDMIVADFSTTGPIERAASEIVLLDAMQPYFKLRLHTMCGIPRITLAGTPDDWRSVQTRARYLGKLGLEHWVKALDPVLDQLLHTSLGKPDASFWRSLYKLESWSGGDQVTGWINVLFPFVHDEDTRETVPNACALDWRAYEGPRATQFPNGLSAAPFQWQLVDRVLSMELIGGFAGVSQDPDSLALRPEIGWAVRPARRAGPQLPIDAETGRPVHHVAFLAPASRLDRMLDDMRVATKAEAGPSGSFRFATANALVHVWRDAPPGELVPSAVVLVLPNVDEEWGDHQAASAVERRLLAAGAMHSVPIHALVTPFSGETSDDLLAAWLRAFPPPVTALFGRDGLARDVSELPETLTSLTE